MFACIVSRTTTLQLDGNAMYYIASMYEFYVQETEFCNRIQMLRNVPELQCYFLHPLMEVPLNLDDYQRVALILHSYCVGLMKC